MRNYFDGLAESTRAKLKAFRKDRRGSIAQMAAVSAIPMLICVGVAVDTVRVSYTSQKLASTLDAAALAAAGADQSLSKAEVKALAKKYVESNFVDPDQIAILDFDIINTDEKIVVKGTARVKTALMMLAQVNYVDVKLSSEVVKSGSNVEVSLVLDNTTSMSSNMTDLKNAAKKFIDKVVTTSQTPYYSKVAIIPYNMGVNLGGLAASARGALITTGPDTVPGHATYTFKNPSNSDKTFNISTCVSERTGTEAYTDAGVATNPVGRAYTPGSANPCIAAQFLPLTSDITTLTNSINSMASGSSTAGQVGIAWGWYALSPNFGLWAGASVPAAYTAPNTRKVMVLMTDAEYNSTYCNGVITGVPTTSGSGSASDHINCAATNGSSYAQSKSLCLAMKLSGIEIYTIEFKLDTTVTARVDLMKDCATDSSHRVTASNATELTAAFEKIAGSLTSMRVSK